MSTVFSVSASSLPDAQVPTDAIAIFGGSFDPIHQGHLSVIKAALENFSTIVIAPTPQNPWKKRLATPKDLRIQMIERVLHAEGIPIASSLEDSGVYLSTIDYTYSVELLELLRNQTDKPLVWIIGEDSGSDIENWRDWQEKGVPVVTYPIRIDTHSTNQREGKEAFHPALAEFIRENNLYK